MMPTSTLRFYNDTAAAGEAETALDGPGASSSSTFDGGSVSVTPPSELYRPPMSMHNGAAAKHVQPSTARMPVLPGNADTRKRKADHPDPYVCRRSKRASMLLLPIENVLDVLPCVDFVTLLALQFSGSAFYDVVHPNLAVLPRLRVFHFYLDLAMSDPTYTLREIVEGTRNLVLSSPFEVPYTDEFDYAMLRPFAEAVGTNFINCAVIACSHGPMQAMEFDMRKAVEALPALKHVRELMFECRCLMRTSYDVDMETLEELILSPLDNLQCLLLGEVNNRTDWAFLRKDWALRLGSLSVEAFGLFHESGESGLPKIDASGQAEILDYCTDFGHLKKGKSKKLKISGWRISPEFLQRIIKTVSECKDWLTVVVDGAPGFVGNDTVYARSDIPPEDPESSWSVGFVRYSALDGSHRVFVQTFDGNPTIAVTNNPVITTWSDTYKWDFEGF